MLNGLDLFSGIGGIARALHNWIIPLAYCEIDSYCQGVLLSRMHMAEIHSAPIWDDIRTFKGEELRSTIDIITAGFPCQDISVAGLRKGLEGERSGLFFEIVRLAKEIRPRFIFFENVPGILSKGGLQVVEEVTEMGYDCRWCVISAAKYVDQRRERWFCLAKFNVERCEQRTSKNIQSKRLSIKHEKSSDYKLSSMEDWTSFTRNLRKNNGISYRMERVRSLGNAVVPEQAKEAFEILMGLKSYG